MPLALIIMAAFVRFLHYALAGEDLTSLQFFVVSLFFVGLGGAYGYRSRRAEQMTRQYPVDLREIRTARLVGARVRLVQASFGRHED